MAISEPPAPEPHEITDRRIRFFRRWFPHLVVTQATFTSARTAGYNCFAYAVGDYERWWEPNGADLYWPAGVISENTPEAWTKIFAATGYQPCGLDASHEEGFEKVALYAMRGLVQHAARQMPSGRWRSKIAVYEDIEHETLQQLEGEDYGKVVLVLRRPR